MSRDVEAAQCLLRDCPCHARMLRLLVSVTYVEPLLPSRMLRLLSVRLIC